MTSKLFRTVIAAALGLAVGTGAANAADSEFAVADLEFFETEIRPLLVEHCYECHSAQAESLQAGLLLDRRGGLMEGGDSGPAIVAGEPDASLLIEAIRYESYEMPPRGKLPDEAIQKIADWIQRGAAWPDEPEPNGDVKGGSPQFDLQQRRQDHWVWQPVTDPSLPAVQNRQWPLADLDHFILAKLEAKGLSPAEPIDRRGLIRRLSFDLVGLPPTPEQIEQFLNDDSPDAVENLVDELLASPHFGERWGRHWLDLVRYADSRGHEFDNDITNAFEYRDYVIRAFNNDVPYDQLVQEHLAGDLLPEPRTNPQAGFNESVLGTGFWFLGEWGHSPVDIRKDEMDRFDNMVGVMSKAFLGVTVACARCHDHKFDAISTRDYYSLVGFLESSDYHEVRFETLDQNRQIAEELDRLEQSTQRQLVDLVVATCEANLKETAEEQIALAFNTLPESASASRTRIRNVSATEAVPVVEASPDVTAEQQARIVADYSRDSDSLLSDGFTFGLHSHLPGEFELPLSELEQNITVRTQGAVVRIPDWNVQNVPSQVTTQQSALCQFPMAGRTFRTKTFEVTEGPMAYLVRGRGHIVACVDPHRLVAGPLHGETVIAFSPESAGASPNQQEAYWVTQNLQRYRGHRAHIEFVAEGRSPLEVLMVMQGEALPDTDSLPNEDLQAADREIAFPAEIIATDSQEMAAGRLQAHWSNVLNTWQQAVHNREPLSPEDANTAGWLLRHAFPQAQHEELNLLLDGYVQSRQVLIDSIAVTSRTAIAMRDGSGEDGVVLIRGNHESVGETVPRRFLEAIDGTNPLPIGSGSGRLELARRITAPDNPLTSRVIVNRLWHHLLGRGIVASTDDFGFLGERPTHPELLDHLATHFVNNGQSIKGLIKYIVLSRTYQMSSAANPDAMAVDPKNALCHHVPVKRLQGEIVRDSLLALSGRLDPAMFGEAVPIHLTDFMIGRGRPGVNGPLDGDGRRSIYIAVRRNFLSPFMLAFDTPAPFSTMGRRNVSNVPAQALILMNDPFVLEQAAGWAARAIVAEPSDLARRLDFMYLTAFGRLPNAEEAQLALEFVGPVETNTAASTAELSKWTDLAHTLINTKEFIFIR